MGEWLYGRHPVFEALRSGKRSVFQMRVAKGVRPKGRVADVLKIAKDRNLRIEYVDRTKLDVINPNHQGVALLVEGYPYRELMDFLELANKTGEAPFILIVDTIQDPQNFGSLLRTAEGVGVHGVIIPLKRSVQVTPAVVSASAGASEHVYIMRGNLAQAINALKREDVWIVGLGQGQDGLPPGEVDLSGPVALVVGSEGRGMRRLVQESCDSILQLPMSGEIESFNAAAAGSIALYLAYMTRSESKIKS